MLAAIASAALIVAGSLTIGQALLTVCGRADARALAGPVGLAAMLAVSAIVAGLGGHGEVAAGALGAVALAGAAVIARAGLPRIGAQARLAAIAASLLAGLFAALPFIAAGAVGILGVGLVNDDMASHLLLADWIDERFRPEPVLVDQGYPLGPHALVAGVGDLLGGARSIDVFAGLTLAIPVLTALLVAGALPGLGSLPRIGVAVLVALPYLAASYLAQEAFKEPILALFLLAFALCLPSVRSAREAIPLGVLAAGAVYVYSFPGLAWLAGTALVWALLTGRRPSRHALAAVGVALAVLAVALAPEAGRLLDFADFRALDPGRANEGGLGNLRGHISPLEALGIWPTSDFRVSASAAGAPAPLFYAGALLAAVALLLALPRWVARHGPAIPAALLTAALLYLAARAFGTVYTSAKALAIAAPLVALITLGGLLGGGRAGPPRKSGKPGRPWWEGIASLPPRGAGVLAAVTGLAMALSSFLVLRQAPVAPEDHMEELAEIRPLVEGKKLLFLGRDNFILYELRGSKPFTAVRNFYDPFYVEPNAELRDVFSKFDFDTVTAETLARFRYVLATSGSYASGPPPGYRAIASTPSYVLFERGRSPLGREPGEDDAAPGAENGCPRELPKRVEAFETTPVAASDWTSARVESGEPATIALELPRGRWKISLQYDATRELTLTAAGYEHILPGNLDYRGSVPYFGAGVLESGGGETTIQASVEEPPLSGRVLGAKSLAHLGTLAAVRAGDPVQMSPAAGCDAYVDWYVR